MFRNYIKTALRNLLHQGGSTFINISGLSLGIACALILFLMISFMSSFDTFHSKRERIYRIVTQSDGNQGKEYSAGVPAVLPDAFRLDFPEAEEVVFMSYRANSLVLVPQRQGESKKFQEERGVVFTEPAYFKTFDRKVFYGDAATGIDQPNEAIISKSLAKKYFEKEDAVGEILKFEDNEYKITGIIDDAPANTDLPFNLILSYITIKKAREENGWNSIWSDEQCYFLLKEGENAKAIETRISEFAKKHIRDDSDNTQFSIQPLSEMHYDDRFDTYSYNTTPRALLIAFGVIAFILILTACINFINLATAEAIKRSKEVGVRKSLGSTRGQLVRQFLGETTLITLVAVFLSVALAQIAISFINPFLELQLSLNFFSSIHIWLFLVTVTIIVSVLSGLYPAFVVSNFNPAYALKNKVSNRTSSGYTLRRALVVVQFAISQLFIIGTIVIIHQMNYFQKKDLGFAKEAILIVPIPNQGNVQTAAVSKMRTLRDQMENVPGVEMASLSSAPPSSGNVSDTNFKVLGSNQNYGTQVKQVDGNYLDLYKLELVAGNNLKDNDSITGFLVNRKLVQTAGFNNSEEIVGKVLRLWGKEYPVVGVVKDFHTVSLHAPIEATVLFNRPKGYENLSIKVDMKQSKQVVSTLKEKWEAAYPEHLFEYHFLDEKIREFYEGEKKMSILLSAFSLMAIFIGCLGLFGLATFMANQKTKEIGVRKVLGASVESIVVMFSKQYITLILTGFILAAPLAWYVMQKFLEEFEYKIDIGPGIFILGLAITLFIAILTVGYKSFKAAIVNPVKSLRYE